MIDLETVEREISELEARQASYKLCERLSWLYIVRDHLKPTPYVTSTAIVPKMQGSDFLKAASGKRVEDVMEVVDEHLQIIAFMYPKTFDSILDRIREL